MHALSLFIHLRVAMSIAFYHRSTSWTSSCPKPRALLALECLISSFSSSALWKKLVMSWLHGMWMLHTFNRMHPAFGVCVCVSAAYIYISVRWIDWTNRTVSLTFASSNVALWLLLGNGISWTVDLFAERYLFLFSSPIIGFCKRINRFFSLVILFICFFHRTQLFFSVTTFFQSQLFDAVQTNPVKIAIYFLFVSVQAHKVI